VIHKSIHQSKPPLVTNIRDNTFRRLHLLFIYGVFNKVLRSSHVIFVVSSGRLFNEQWSGENVREHYRDFNSVSASAFSWTEKNREKPKCLILVLYLVLGVSNILQTLDNIQHMSNLPETLGHVQHISNVLYCSIPLD
jgi:hypothetical protein